MVLLRFGTSRRKRRARGKRGYAHGFSQLLLVGQQLTTMILAGFEVQLVLVTAFLASAHTVRDAPRWRRGWTSQGHIDRRSEPKRGSAWGRPSRSVVVGRHRAKVVVERIRRGTHVLGPSCGRPGSNPGGPRDVWHPTLHHQGAWGESVGYPGKGPPAADRVRAPAVRRAIIRPVCIALPHRGRLAESALESARALSRSPTTPAAVAPARAQSPSAAGVFSGCSGLGPAAARRFRSEGRSAKGPVNHRPCRPPGSQVNPGKDCVLPRCWRGGWGCGASASRSSCCCGVGVPSGCSGSCPPLPGSSARWGVRRGV